MLEIILNNLSISKQNLFIFQEEREDLLVVDDFHNIFEDTEVRVQLFYNLYFLLLLQLEVRKTRNTVNSLN